MTTLKCKLDQDLCRCCLAEGSFQSLSEPFFVKSRHEIYSEMLKETLNIEIMQISGDYSAMTFTICDDCIQRLQDAHNFKKKVKISEKRFQEMLPGMKALNESVKVKVESDEDVKMSEIKEEFEVEDDDDYLPEPDLSDDEDDNKTMLEIKLERSKKTKPKPKAKSKPKKKEEDILEDKTQKKALRKGPKQEYYTVRDDGFHCKLCQKSFVSQPLISQHYRFVHLKKRPRERKCPKCDEKIPGYLKAYHMEEAHGITAPTCGVCQKKFRYPCHVLQHQKKVHMGEKTVECNVCDKTFFNSLSLKLHMATHSSEKKYKCQICHRQFRWVNNLKDHVKIHTDDRKFVCGVCGKAFVQKSTLKQHTIRTHPEAI